MLSSLLPWLKPSAPTRTSLPPPARCDQRVSATLIRCWAVGHILLVPGERSSCLKPQMASAEGLKALQQAPGTTCVSVGSSLVSELGAAQTRSLLKLLRGTRTAPLPYLLIKLYPGRNLPANSSHHRPDVPVALTNLPHSAERLFFSLQPRKVAFSGSLPQNAACAWPRPLLRAVEAASS